MRKPSDIPFAQDSSRFFVGWISMLMVFIATLICAFALITYSSVQAWYDNISGSLTVQIPSYDKEGKSRKDVLQNDIETALTILRSTDGITGANVLDDSQMDLLMAPWMGDQVATSELPLPKIIDVSVDTHHLPDLAQIKADLAEQVPLAVLDSHRVALADLVDLAYNVIKLVGGVLLLLLVSMAFSIMFVTQSGLKVHQQVIALIHLMGAGDFYITRQFANRSFVISLTGSLIGFALALPVMMGFAYCLNNLTGSFILIPALSGMQWGVLIAIPFLAAVLAYLTAFRTVWSALKRSL